MSEAEPAFVVRPGSPAEKLFYSRAPSVLCDGPTGSGKTRPALEKLWYFADTFKGLRGLIVRKSKAHASASVMATWEQEVVPPGHPAAVLRQEKYRSPAYLFGNGSTVAVDGMYDGAGYNQAVMGTAWDFVVMDEATQFTKDDFMRLSGRMDRGGGLRCEAPYSQMILTTNPDAPSHWLWRDHLAGKIERIPSRLEDNPVFHDGHDWTEQGRKYLRRLDHYTGAMRQRNRYGLWVGVDGLIYDQWDEAVHVADAMPENTNYWWRIRAIDFGYNNPSVCQWWALEPDGKGGVKTAWLERELVRVQTDTIALAELIKRHTPDERLVYTTVADIEDANARAILNRYGVPTVGCEKPRSVAEWPQHLGTVMRMLAGGDGPRLRVLRSALIDRDSRAETIPVGLVDEITQYAWEPPTEGRNHKEKPRDANNHSCDAMRYFCRYLERHGLPGGKPIPDPAMTGYDAPKPKRASMVFEDPRFRRR